MKESLWVDCLEDNKSVKQTPNAARASSLKETAEARLRVIKEVTKENINFVFEDYYTSIIEFLQALVISQGFKVLNHLCLGYYLRDEVMRGDLYELFNDLRYKRNALTYYGDQMGYLTAQQAIKKSLRLIKELKKLLC